MMQKSKDHRFIYEYLGYQKNEHNNTISNMNYEIYV